MIDMAVAAPTIEEQWTAANSNVMLATTRYLDDNDGRTRGWEFSPTLWSPPISTRRR